MIKIRVGFCLFVWVLGFFLLYLAIKKHLDHQLMNLDTLGTLSMFAFLFVYIDIWIYLSTEFEHFDDYKIMGHI